MWIKLVSTACYSYLPRSGNFKLEQLQWKLTGKPLDITAIFLLVVGAGTI
ncbi:MAG: hypothetical protein ACK5Q2_11800 [Bacteroidota bacterium]